MSETLTDGCDATLYDGYAVIVQARLPDTVSEARTLQVHLNAYFLKHRLQRVVWDMRAAKPNAEAGRVEMWRWLNEYTQLKASAFVVESSMLRVSTNMRALSGGARVRSFATVESAAEWLNSLQ